MKSSRWLGSTIIIVMYFSLSVGATSIAANVTNITVTEGDDVTICISPSTDNSENFTVSVEVSSSSTAMNGSDYDLNLPSDNFVKTNSAESVCFDIYTIDDNAKEQTKLINITISTDNDAVMVNDSTVLVYIEDNDALEPYLLNGTVVEGSEGDSLEICVGINGSSYKTEVFPFSVNYGTADMDDFNFTANDVTIIKGSQSGCVSLTLVEDNSVELNESFIVSFNDETLGNITVNIQDTNIVTLTVNSSVSVAESDGKFIVCAVPVNSDLGIPEDYPLLISIEVRNMTAKEGLDFNLENRSLSHPGCLSVDVYNDNSVEGNEEFVLQWTVDQPKTVFNNSLTTVTIRDSSNATIGFENSVVSVSESESNYSPNLTVLSGNIDVDFNVSVKYDNGTATEGDDFLFSNIYSTSWIPMVNVSIREDNVVERNETFILLLELLSSELNIAVSPPNQTVTITDDDEFFITPPGNFSVNESSADRLCLSVSGDIAPTRTGLNYLLHYSISDGAAVAGKDYTLPTTGSVNISFNSSRKICVDLQIVDDSDVEGNENFTIHWFLDSDDIPSGIKLSMDSTLVTIVDDDFVDSTSTTATTATTTTPTSTATTGTSQTSSTMTSSTASPVSEPILGTIAIIGIICGVVAAGACVLLVLVCAICCARLKMNRTGFYDTNEDKGEAPQMLRYSASLRSLQSQTVMPADPRDKENEYMV